MTHANAPTPLPHVAALSPYIAGKSGDKGQRVIKLSSNESNFGPSPKAIEALQKGLRGLHRYPDGSHADLREALGEVHGITPKRILCGNGSDELISLLLHCYCAPGDNIVYSEHGFLMYSIYAQGFGVEAIAAKEVALTAHVDNLLTAVTDRTKIVFLANPNNPTGSMLPRGEIERLHAALPPQVLLVIDAAYAEYPEGDAYEDGQALAETHANVVMLRTFSKCYALAALRLGWMVASEAVINAVGRVRSPFNVNALALAAGTAATRDQSHIAEVVALTREFRNDTATALADAGIIVHPSHTNFLLLEFSTSGNKTASDANRYLTEQGVILREVANYGLPHCLRMSIGLGVENAAVVDILTRFMRG